MAEQIPLELPEKPRLAGNIVHFARALRRAGLPIGPGRVIDAIHAVEAAGFTEKHDFYYTLQPPALGENSVDEFLFGTRWTPLLEPRSFGVLPLVAGTMLIVVGAFLGFAAGCVQLFTTL